MRTYETHLKRRTKRILQELANVRLERAQRRAGRRKSGFHLVAITGYTNSGKSSLLNALCGSEAYVEDLYFSTLQTTTRRLKPALLQGRHSSLLFTDTVGFIRNLPPWLIDAFGSTLEEVVASDVVLLVVDVAEDPMVVKEKLATAWSLLDQLQAPKRRFILLNKADLLSSLSRSDILTTLSLPTHYPHTWFLWTSTHNSEGLLELVRRLLDDTSASHRVRVRLNPLTPGHLALESWIRDHTEVLKERDDSPLHEFVVQCSPEQFVQMRRQTKQVDATLEELASTGN